MKSQILAIVLLLAPALVSAQDKGVGTTIYPYPGPTYTELKQFLTLTDAQVQSLQTVMTNRNQAMQNIYTQMAQKNDTLYQLLNSDSGTAAQLGQLLLDVRNLQKQLPGIDAPYKTQALAILTADQKAKLPKLVEAFQLQVTASEAASLLLIDYPQYGGPPVIMSPNPAAADTMPRMMMPARQ